MDPDKTLEQTRELVQEVLRDYYRHGEVDNKQAAILAELVDNLDQWLSKPASGGGFLPADWASARSQQEQRIRELEAERDELLAELYPNWEPR